MPQPFSGIDKDAPLWVQQVSAVMLALWAAKSQLLNVPGIKEASLTLAGQWFDYIAQMISVALTIMMLFGKKSVKDGAKTVVLFLAIVMLSGCYTASKATKQVVRAQVHYPEVLAGICGDLYPPKEYRKDSIIYKPGAVITVPGKTVYVDCNSDSNKGKTDVPVACPPSTMQIDTVYSKSEIQVENTAKVTALELQQGKLQSAYDRLDVKANWYLWWAIAASAALAIGVFLKLKKIV